MKQQAKLRHHAAIISVMSMVEERRKNTIKKPFSATAKVKSLVVWWTYSEVSKAKYERQTISKHDNLNQRRCSHTQVNHWAVSGQNAKQARKGSQQLKMKMRTKMMTVMIKAHSLPLSSPPPLLPPEESPLNNWSKAIKSQSGLPVIRFFCLKDE